MTVLWVDPSALSGAGTSLGAVGDGLAAAVPTLTGAFNANTGQDAAGVLFGRQYVDTGRDLLQASTAGINALRNTAYGVQMSATNYSRAEAQSDLSGRAQSLPSPPCPAPKTAPSPPSPTGGGVAEPALWVVVEFLVGDLWPNGDPSAMRSAAAAWRTFGIALNNVGNGVSGPRIAISGQKIAEGELIAQSINDIETMLTAVAGMCATMASALDDFAGDVEHTQQSVRDLLNKLGSVGGIIGTFFEFLKGHGEDELDEIADDIKQVSHHLKDSADAKSALVQSAKANVTTFAHNLEKMADRTFDDFFGESIGRVLASPIHVLVDSYNGAFQWVIGNAEGITELNPLRFVYDPQGALQAWKGAADTAALFVPPLAAVEALTDPDGAEAAAKGLLRIDQFDPNHPLESLVQSGLDVVTAGIPGLGEAGVAGDAASAAGRASRAAGAADEASGVARNLDKLSDITKTTNTLGDVSKQTSGISKKLDEIAAKPTTSEPPAGGQPITPKGPVEPSTPLVARPPAPESAPPRSEVPSQKSTAPAALPAEAAPAPVGERAPVSVPNDSPPPLPREVTPPPLPPTSPSAGAVPSGGGAPVEPARPPHVQPPETPTPQHTEPAPSADGEQGGRHGDNQHGDGTGADTHHPDDHDGSANQPTIGTPTEFDPNSLRGMSVEQIRSMIPPDWIVRSAKRGTGDVFEDPLNTGRQIRIMDGYTAGNRPDPVTHGPYVVMSQNGRKFKIPLEGNPTLEIPG